MSRKRRTSAEERAELRDELFHLWCDTVPAFAICTIVDVMDGLPVNPDALRLAMPFAESLRAALTA